MCLTQRGTRDRFEALVHHHLDSSKDKNVNPRKIIAATGIVGALIFTSACSTSVAASPADTSSPSSSTSATAVPSATPTLAAAPATPSSGEQLQASTLGIIGKGVANDGKGDYLQSSIADTDAAMQYNPAITDDAAKAHYSPEQLADAHKVIVKFIAEEAIDSTLNGGTDVDGWFAAHKDQLHPVNQDAMLEVIKSPDKAIVDREAWMLTPEKVASGYSYLHHANKSRVTARTITPLKLYYVKDATLQGVMLDTTAMWNMAVHNGHNNSLQSTTAEISFAVAIDPADGKWKIAGYLTNYHTAEG